MIPARDEANESNFNLESNLSNTLTPVALEGPLFLTVIVYSTRSVTLTTVTLTTLLILISTTGKEVTLSELPLLLDLFVSFSLLVTLTLFSTVPFAII